MQIVVSYDPDTKRLSFSTGGPMLPLNETQDLRAALVKMAERQPELVPLLEYHGSVLTLESPIDDAGKVLASMFMQLEYGMAAHELTPEIWFGLLEREELQQAYSEHVFTTLVYGDEAAKAALEEDEQRIMSYGLLD